jgi:cytoskeletal protein CcmA (bactofilin family)
MFKKSSPQPPATPRADRNEQSFLQNGVRLQGEIEVAGDLRVEGTVKGGLSVRGVLLIGAKAVVDGDIKGREVVIHGHVGGTLRADERIHLAKGAKVKGDLYCRSLIIDEGVHFEGRSHMDEKPEGSAPSSRGAALPDTKKAKETPAGRPGGLSADSQQRSAAGAATRPSN